MMDERRYADDEVAEILEAAAQAFGPGGRGLAREQGLSLAELQAIGAEVGIAPERIAQAALALDLRGAAAPRRTHLGLPVSVGRTVDLPRAPTDREWETLVAELRQTFGAHGKDRSSGGLRAWTNGNLRAYVEPTDEGHRLRLGTTKGDGEALGRMGVAGVLGGLLMLAFLSLTAVEGAGMGLFIALMGVLVLAANAVRLPRWAAEREAQMEYIATRARALIPAGDPVPRLDGA